MTVVPNPVHPAKYSPPILDLIGRLVDEETARVGRPLRIIDPMCGVGRVHDLNGLTVGGDLELGWAACRRPSVQADASRPPFRRRCFDVYVTSPSYSNRMADNHVPRDTHKACGGDGCRACKGTGISPRKTYRVANGGPLHPNNSGAMQWGARYRDAHIAIWARIPALVVAGGLVIVNVSDHIRDGVEQHVAGWHHGQLQRSGVRIVDVYAVPTDRMLHGENYEARPDVEYVFAGRAAS